MKRITHKDRITIARAKELCRALLGRLPLCGYAVTVETGEEPYTWTNLDGVQVTRTVPFQTELFNEGGRYRVSTHYATGKFPLRGIC